jgi:MFS family permease
VAAWTLFQLGRLLAAERATTGGPIALPLDDSYIYLQYARAIAEGHPFVYTPGNAPTTGSTSLWYPLLLLPPHLLRLQPGVCVAWALALGAALYAASALLLARLGTRLGGPVGGFLATLLFAASPHLLWGYFSGMEIALYGTALLLAADAYSRERKAALFPTLRWWLLLLAGARPEGAVLCGVFALLMAGDRWRASRAPGGPAFWSPVLLVPVAAAALPFLVNLAVSGSLESTSSQAKSILSEPYAESRAVYLQNTPTILLNIGTMLLSLLILGANSAPVASLVVASGIGALLFALLAFWPRRGPWNGGAFLLALVGCGIVVNAIPVHWFVHLFRYQQGLLTLAILAVAAGWGRLAWWAWERWPRGAGAPVAGLAAVAPAAVWLSVLIGTNVEMVPFYARNCENILHQQVRVGRWIDANLPRNAVVGLNDAGAIAYYGRRSTVDLVGLTSAGFARVYRSGSGCLFEHMRRLPPDRLPTHAAIYPEWFSYWPESGILGPELFRAHLDFNTICGGTDMVVYPATWSGVRPDERPVAAGAGLGTLRLTDSLDLAWLEDERRHEWKADPEAKDVLRRYSFAELPSRAVTDGGRIVRRAERFRADVQPGRDLTIVMRTDAWYPTRLRVQVDGKEAGIWSFALSETAWVEPRFTVRGSLLTRPRPEIALVRQTADGAGETGRDYSAFRLWLYQ